MGEIKQLINYKGETFSEGDVLKVTVETEGTKNVYTGKFLFFDRKGIFKQRTYLVFRHHTFCQEGLFSIEDTEITNIQKLECKKK
jgi:hypothetical protein